MLLHHKQQASPVFWAYRFAAWLSVSRLGTLYFRHDGKKAKKGSLWWHFYLLNYAKRFSKEQMQQRCRETVSIDWVQPYHFSFYSVFFHVSAISHILYELADQRLPYMNDRFQVWTDFFKQPFETVDHKPETANTKKECMYRPWFAPYCKTVTAVWIKLCRDFVCLNRDTAAYVQAECDQLLTPDRKVLGVLCRGTDYVTTKPKNHPKQPDPEEIIALCRKWIKKYGYNAIYLATDEERLLRMFREAFPGMILENKRTYYDKIMQEQSLVSIANVRFDRENDEHLKGLEYLSSLMILSRCHSMIAGNCGGSRMALFLNGGRFAHCKIFDKGLY